MTAPVLTGSGSVTCTRKNGPKSGAAAVNGNGRPHQPMRQEGQHQQQEQGEGIFHSKKAEELLDVIRK
jgi:hypothetical protein